MMPNIPLPEVGLTFGRQSARVQRSGCGDSDTFTVTFVYFVAAAHKAVQAWSL